MPRLTLTVKDVFSEDVPVTSLRVNGTSQTNAGQYQGTWYVDVPAGRQHISIEAEATGFQPVAEGLVWDGPEILYAPAPPPLRRSANGFHLELSASASGVLECVVRMLRCRDATSSSPVWHPFLGELLGDTASFNTEGVNLHAANVILPGPSAQLAVQPLRLQPQGTFYLFARVLRNDVQERACMVPAARRGRRTVLAPRGDDTGSPRAILVWVPQQVSGALATQPRSRHTLDFHISFHPFPPRGFGALQQV